MFAVIPGHYPHEISGCFPPPSPLLSMAELICLMWAWGVGFY